LCCILTDLQLHSVSVDKRGIVYILKSFPVLVCITVISHV
jgi:hypothetical protein